MDEFDRDGGQGPDLCNILLDWSESLTCSEWNNEAIGLMMTEFIGQLRDGLHSDVVFNASCITYDKLKKLCVRKLLRTQRTLRSKEEIAMDSSKETEVQEARDREILRARRYGRRKGVSELI